MSKDLETEERIHSSLKSSLVWLEKMDLSSTIEANIFTELLAGRKTVAELAEIFVSRPQGQRALLNLL